MESSAFDLHLHSIYSKHSVLKPRTIVKQAKKVGLQGIAITDHDNCRAWKQIIGAGKEFKLQIVKGEELKVTFHGKKAGELMALFLKEPIKSREIHEVIDEIKKQNALLIVPHPFDLFRRHFQWLSEFNRKLDAIEGFNARCFSPDFNLDAQKFAKNYNLALTGGSDAHFLEEIGRGKTVFQGNSASDLYHAIKNKKTQVSGHLSELNVHLMTPFAKFGLLKKV